MGDQRALVIGGSDGVGLALVRRLLGAGWRVAGVSRSPGRVEDPGYEHTVADVTDPGYRGVLGELWDGSGPFDLCVYCAGVGDSFDAGELSEQGVVFAVNLMGAVATVEVLAPRMVAAGGGHIIGLSSLADRLVSPEAPAYAASKAGMSSYLMSLAVALRPHGVAVTQVRFGFVDTKMAKADRKPFLMTAERAADILMRGVHTRPPRISRPRRMAVALALARAVGRSGARGGAGRWSRRDGERG